MKWGFLPVMIAVASIVAALTILRGHDLRTEEILSAKTAEVRESPGRTAFNLLILPKKPSATMPEDYASRITNARLMQIGQIQALFQQNVQWLEEKQAIRLIGVRGERPSRGGDPKAALDPVPADGIALGYQLHHASQYTIGDPIGLRGKQFTIARLEPARNSEDDRTAWIHLKDAQEMLGQKDRIQGILIENARVPRDRLGGVRAEVARQLPQTRVIEFGTRTLAHAEAAIAAKATVEAERTRQRGEDEAFAAVLVPLVVAANAVGFVWLITFRASRTRPAPGAIARQIIIPFIGQAAWLGLAGTMLGYAIGWLLGAAWLGETDRAGKLFDPMLLLAVCLATPLFCGAVAALPALVEHR